MTHRELNEKLDGIAAVLDVIAKVLPSLIGLIQTRKEMRRLHAEKTIEKKKRKRQ